MDTSLNYIDYKEENIRPPDEVKKEKLLEFQDIRSEFENQVQEAMYRSLQESSQMDELNQKFEEEIINKYLLETSVRREKFGELLLDINRIMRFDKELKEIYEIIEPVIEAYCCHYIEFFEIDKETYDKIFQVIGTIRTNKKNIENLKSIIIIN
jgi:hypothetical protein